MFVYFATFQFYKNFIKKERMAKLPVGVDRSRMKEKENFHEKRNESVFTKFNSINERNRCPSRDVTVSLRHFCQVALML